MFSGRGAFIPGQPQERRQTLSVDEFVGEAAIAEHGSRHGRHVAGQTGRGRIDNDIEALAAVMLATLIQIAAWQVIMAGMGIYVGRWHLAQGYMLPFLARYIPGSVWGYLGRSQWMNQN